MLKKVTTDIKAAIVLIVTENVTALRGFIRNLTNSTYKSVPKRRNSKQQKTKRTYDPKIEVK
jgi:hypothetical protein